MAARRIVYNPLVASGKARSTATPDFHVGRWLAQPPRNLILNGGIARHLEPQVMDLLVFLANSGGRVVSKDEIIDAVVTGRRGRLPIADADPDPGCGVLRKTDGATRLRNGAGAESVVLPFTRPDPDGATRS